MQAKLISFSISKDCVIITYSLDGKEINAIIEPFSFCTHLKDLNVIENRKMVGDTLMVSYLGGWIQWRMFVCDSQMDCVYTDGFLQVLLERHLDTEMFKELHHASGNCKFSFN
jgi:hypothetical protein